VGVDAASNPKLTPLKDLDAPKAGDPFNKGLRLCFMFAGGQHAAAGNADEGPRILVFVIYHYYRFVDQSKTGENSKNTQLYYFKHQDPGANDRSLRRRSARR
jgi:hypothetical protein